MESFGQAGETAELPTSHQTTELCFEQRGMEPDTSRCHPAPDLFRQEKSARLYSGPRRSKLAIDTLLGNIFLMPMHCST